MRLTAKALIGTLGLEPHPEGGYFRETYRAGENVEASALPARFAGARSFSTAIHFLLTADTFSAFHRIASDEVWHFYAGAPINLEVLHPEGRHETIRLGNDPSAGMRFQAVVPAGCWFGAALAGNPDPEDFALVGCTVAPGFDFEDFELAERAVLFDAYPAHRAMIERLTR
jgi:hypothetical protein